MEMKTSPVILFRGHRVHVMFLQDLRLGTASYMAHLSRIGILALSMLR